MPITSLYFTDIGPFDEIVFEFDPQVNVFTGPNNSGKTAALLTLGELLVYPFVAPDKLYRSDKPEWKLCYSIGTKVNSLTDIFQLTSIRCYQFTKPLGTRVSCPHNEPVRFSCIRTLCDSGSRIANRGDCEEDSSGISNGAEETRYRRAARPRSADEECGISGIEKAQHLDLDRFVVGR